jgi:hypothetical protein
MSKLNVKNAQFLYGAAGGVPATVFGQVMSGSVDLGEVSMVDTTTVTDETKTNVAGTRESMSGSVTLAWDPAESSHAALMTKYLAKTLGSIGFKLRTTAASPVDIVHYYADAFITNISAPIASNAGDSAMECTMNFKASGAYTKV